MPSYDNKVLNGAGVAKLSQLVKDAIASGVAEEEIYIGSTTPSTSLYKVWIDTSGQTDTFVKGVTVNGAAVVLDGNYVANLTGIQGTMSAGQNISISNDTISAQLGYPTTTDNTSLAWNQQVLRSTTDTTAFTCVQPTGTTRSQEICGFFLADGTTCSFTVANATVTDGENTSTAGAALTVDVEDGKVYEFSLMAMTSTSTSLLLKEVG